MKNITQTEFIESKILEAFAQYYKLFLEKYSPQSIKEKYSWDDMIAFIDPEQSCGIEHWISYIQLWTTISEKDGVFFGTYIHNKLHSKKQSIRSAQKLSLGDVETIMSLACVMSYAIQDKKEFYRGVKRALEDCLLDLAS